MEEENHQVVYKLNNPFSDEIMAEPLPGGVEAFQFQPRFLHDTNPMEHLLMFHSQMLLHKPTDAVKCRVFPTTLDVDALRWFFCLPPKSIHSFQNLADVFLKSFALNRSPPSHIYKAFRDGIRQRQGESVQSFVSRVNRLVAGIVGVQIEDIVTIIVNGLKDGEFKTKMLEDRPKHMQDLWERVNLCWD